MKIHLITNLFHPDELAGAALYTDMALFLREHGHEVRVTTTFSYYPAWKVSPEDQGCALREEVFEGIPVRRVAMHVPSKVSGASRMISDASFLLALVHRGTFPGWIPEVVITAEPMLSQALAQRFLYPGRRIPRLIIVQDFVVDAALELSILRLPGLAGILHAVERWALTSAATLVTISELMQQKLRAKVRGVRPVRLIPNWIHGSLQAEIDRQSARVSERAPATLFYSGNVGVKQGLPDFVSDFLSVGEGWWLKIHGGGAQAVELQTVAAKADSISLGGVLEEKEYVSALRRSTACLVTQKPGVGANFLPSKLLPALATGTPVLAICEERSPLGAEVLAGGFGAVIAAGDREGLRATLQSWAAQPELLAELGRRASERAQLYQRERILARYEGELLQLTARG